jgi:hypothetical protein
VEEENELRIARSISGYGGIETLYNEPLVVGPTAKGAGSWAECEQIHINAEGVEWRFRFQGWTAEDRGLNIHNGALEAGWNEKAESVKQRAKLRTIWAVNGR